VEVFDPASTRVKLASFYNLGKTSQKTPLPTVLLLLRASVATIT
jgi:hypothetical protein